MVVAALSATLRVVADGAYRDLAVGLLSVAFAVFLADFFILLLVKRRTVLAVALKVLALTVVNCVLFFAAGVYWFGPVAIFRPHADAEAERTLAETSSVSYERSEDGSLCGWRYDCGQPDAPVILCFYGNGETASQKMTDFLLYLRQGYFAGFDIAVYDYPGYGHATGRPTEASVTATALAACDRLLANGDTVCVYGYSIGTGPANYVAANRDIAALALMAPYADGYDLFNNFIPVFHSAPMRALVSFKMESCRLAEDVSVKPLILATRNDRTVPFASSERLAGCYEEAELRQVDVSDHWTFWDSAECLQAASDYFREALS